MFRCLCLGPALCMRAYSLAYFLMSGLDVWRCEEWASLAVQAGLKQARYGRGTNQPVSVYCWLTKRLRWSCAHGKTAGENIRIDALKERAGGPVDPVHATYGFDAPACTSACATRGPADPACVMRDLDAFGSTDKLDAFGSTDEREPLR